MMDINQEVIDYCETQCPVLDAQYKFMFFSNYKVAHTSINRRLLRPRSIICKDNPTRYGEHYKEINIDLFKSMYKFTIVRNPWSRVVSAFFYLRNNSSINPPRLQKGIGLKSLTFDYFVCNILAKIGPSFERHFHRQYPKAFYNGECFLDFIGKIENLQSDWKKIAGHIEAPDALPHSNKSKHKPYQAYYKSASVEAVRNIYQQDIDAFGYTFGE